MYDMPTEIDVRADGPLRIITLNRPDSLNSVNDDLHHGLAKLWQRVSDDRTARAAVITGAGRAFSAGGDFAYLAELAGDADLRAKTIADGREIVLGMARCRMPVVAAVNGPAVGLGCSLVALSDIVYIAEDAYLADPHVQVGLVAADGGPLTWPLHISLLLAKEYALTGTRISAERAVELGLANHVVADPVAEAVKCAQKIMRTAAAGGREHQTRPQRASRARGAGHPRLRSVRGKPVLPDRGLPLDRDQVGGRQELALEREASRTLASECAASFTFGGCVTSAGSAARRPAE